MGENEVAADQDDEESWGNEVARLMGINVEGLTGPDPQEQLNQRRTQLLALLNGHVPEGATSEQIAPGSVPDELSGLIQRAGQLRTLIGQADLPGLAATREHIDEIGRDVETERKKVADRKERKSALELSRKEVGAPPEGACEDDLKPITTAAQQFSDALAITPLTDTALENADKAMSALTKATETAGQNILKRKQGATQIAQLAGQIAAPKGAQPDEIKQIEDLQTKISTQLKITPLTNKALSDASGYLTSLKEAIPKITEAISGRKTKAAAIEKEAGEVILPQHLSDTEGPLLETARELITTKLADPLSDETLSLASTALNKFKEEVTRIGALSAERVKLHDKINDTGKEITEKGYLEDHKTLLNNKRKALDDALEPPITDKRNEKAQTALEALQLAAQTVTSDMEKLGGLDAIEKLCDAADMKPDAYAALEKDLGGRTDTGEALKVFGAESLGNLCKTIDAKDLKLLMDAFGGAAELNTALTALGGAKALKGFLDTGKTAAEIETMCDKMGTGLMAEMLKSGDAKSVTDLYDALEPVMATFGVMAKDCGLADKPAAMVSLFRTGCDGDATKFRDMVKGFSNEEDRQKLKSLVDGGGLGDAPDALGALLASGCDGDVNALKQMGASFAGEDAQKGLKRMLTDAGLAGEKYEKDKDKIDPKCLGLMMKHAAGPKPPGMADDDDLKRRTDGLADLFKGMDSDACKKLNATITTSGLGDAPEALGQIIGIGCDGKPEQLKSFNAEFGKKENAEALKRMLTDGGLAGQSGDPDKFKDGDIDPACLGHLLKHGGGPAADTDAKRMKAMADLMKGLDGNACKKLDKMLSEGGLGQAPEAMAHLVGSGCDGKPDKLKTLQAGFDDKANRDGLARMLKHGGLKGKTDDTGRAVVDPECLTQMFKDIQGPAPDGDSEAKRAKALGKLCKDIPEDACKALAKTLETGGLGAEREVLGKLVGTGCTKDDGECDGAKLAALVKELDSSGSNAKLAKLLQTGGFGGKDKDGKDIAPKKAKAKPECLAKLLNPGCNEDPKELSKLLNTLDDTDMKRLNGLMDSGELGQHPEVLGDLYRNGCLQNTQSPPANGAGAKNPQILKDILAEFPSQADADLFGDMMSDAHMDKWDGATKVSRLGSLVRHGLTPKGGGTPDAKKLKQLFSGFKGEAQKLDTMCTRFEGAPDYMMEGNKQDAPNQPGTAIQNLLNAPKIKALNDAGKLKSDFYDKMEAYAPTSQGTDKEKLMQTAASFEHLSPLPGKSDLSSNGGTTLEVDVGHIVARHSRGFNQVKNSHTAQMHNLPTSLYPRGIGEAEVKAKVTATMNAIESDASKVLPADASQLNANGKLQHKNVNAGGDKSTIGFSKSGADAIIGQFYPVQTQNMQKVSCADINKLNSILRT